MTEVSMGICEKCGVTYWLIEGHECATPEYFEQASDAIHQRIVHQNLDVTYADLQEWSATLRAAAAQARKNAELREEVNGIRRTRDEYRSLQQITQASLQSAKSANRALRDEVVELRSKLKGTDGNWQESVEQCRALQDEVERLKRISGERFVGLLSARNYFDYFDPKGGAADSTRTAVIKAIAYAGTTEPQEKTHD